MVQRMLQLLHKEWSGLHQAAFLLAGASLASQLLGLVRDRLLASTFGAGTQLDIYYTAFRVPDLIYVTIASFVSITVLIPFVVRVNQDHNRETVRQFLNGIFTVFTVVMIIAVVILWLIMPRLAFILAPGFDLASARELIFISRILLLSPLLLGVSNLLGGVTQSFHKFFAYTVSPIAYNLGIVIGIVFFQPYLGLAGIAWGVVLGAVLHLMIQLPTIIGVGLLPRPTTVIPWREIRSMIMTSLPRTLTLATYQLSMAALVALGSLLISGAIAVFNLAQNLQTVPMMIIGLSYAVAAFPTLAKHFSAGETEAFKNKMIIAARHITFWSMPSIVFMIVLRAHIVRVVLGGGAFDWTDTRLTAAALAMFVLSASAQGLVQLFVRGYYATSNTIKPLVINIFSSVLIVGGAWGLVAIFKLWPMTLLVVEQIFRIGDVPGSIVLALPLAFSIGTAVNALLFIIVFEKDLGGLIKPLIRTTLEATTASVIGGLVTYGLLFFGSPIFELKTLLGVFLQALATGSVGILVWAITLTLLKNAEFLESLTALRVKFAPKNRVVAEQGEL